MVPGLAPVPPQPGACGLASEVWVASERRGSDKGLSLLGCPLRRADWLEAAAPLGSLRSPGPTWPTTGGASAPVSAVLGLDSVVKMHNAAR